MHGQVVEDDDVAGLQASAPGPARRRRGSSRLSIGPSKTAGAVSPSRPQRRDDGMRLPVAARRVIVQARAAETAAIAAQQIGGHAALIEKDVLARVAERHAPPPPPTLRGDVRAPLLVGVYRFF